MDDNLITENDKFQNSISDGYGYEIKKMITANDVHYQQLMQISILNDNYYTIPITSEIKKEITTDVFTCNYSMNTINNDSFNQDFIFNGSTVNVHGMLLISYNKPIKTNYIYMFDEDNTIEFLQ